MTKKGLILGIILFTIAALSTAFIFKAYKCGQGSEMPEIKSTTINE
jgi:hypothetical protein